MINGLSRVTRMIAGGLAAVLLAICPLPMQMAQADASDNITIAQAFQAMQAQYNLRLGTLTFEDIDFKNIAVVDSFPVLLDYLLLCKRQGVKQLPIRLKEPLTTADIAEVVNTLGWVSAYSEHLPAKKGIIDMLLTLEEYPGARIADAYANGSTRGLNEEETRVYNIAVEYLRTKYPKDASEIVRERSIYDFIIKSCEYWTDNGQYEGTYTRFRSALGVFLDGQANCSGYTDAFVMLGRMAGFNVDIMIGEANDEAHAWNMIELGGSWYMVDLTNNGLNKSVPRYSFFNVGQDMMSVSHSWSSYAMYRDVVKRTDWRFAYGNAAFPDLFRVPGAWELEDLVYTRGLAGESTTINVMVETFDGEVESHLQNMFEAFAAKNETLPEIARFYMIPGKIEYTRMGGALFLTIEMERVDPDAFSRQ